MKLNIGDKYTLSEKLKNAFDVKESESKIISLSSGIVTLQVGKQLFHLKEEIALQNLSQTYTVSANSEGSRKSRHKKEIKIEPVAEPIIQPVVIEPVVEPVSPPEVAEVPVQNPVEEPKPAPVDAPIPEPVSAPVEPVTVVEKPEENVIIQPIPQDNPESTVIITPEQVEPEPEEFNPDEGFI